MKINLMEEAKQKNRVILTTFTKKITIDGHTTAYSVYQIDLDYLYYNNQNDRIATWLNKYLSEGNKFPTDKEEYNKVIENFIVESNPQAIKETKSNIDLVDQREPGVVLNDGRIIDGNRRFTCLRQLHKEQPLKHQFFEAIILDKDINTDTKQIKLLELMIQHGEETKIDYNPIDKLVGLYNDVIKNKILTEDEYKYSTNMKTLDFNNKKAEAQLMIDFLDYIEKPGKFYIVRDLNLDGPLLELVAILKKTPEDKIEDLKKAVFNMFLVSRGDLTRTTRRIKKIINYPVYLDQFINDHLKISEKIIDSVFEISNEKDLIGNLSNNSDLKNDVNNALAKAEEGVGLENLKDGPLVQTQKALNTLNLLNVDLISKMESSKIDDLIDLLNDLENRIKFIRGKINV